MRGASYIWGRLLPLGAPTGRGPGSGPCFLSAAGRLPRSLEGPHSCPSRGHVSTGAPVPIPAPLLQTPSKPGDGRAEGRGQKERIWGVSTTLPLVDASKTDLCHEAHPSLKSAGPTLGELGVGAGMRRPERRTLQKSCPEAQPRVRALRKGPPTSCVTLTQSSSHTSWAPFSLIKVIGSTPQRLCLPLPSTPSGRAAISRLHSCPLPPAHLHSAARVSLIKGDSGPAISLLVPHPDPLPCELKTFAFSSFTGLSGIFHCRRK